ncbi:hypothetical protein ACJIZ3_007418 [Penstemon smallii]|uniref:Uncharacterized protein n=1 Tax=Penstemon smallii TaxID=265156 RepID=A0ABD3SAF8_9LAMI
MGRVTVNFSIAASATAPSAVIGGGGLEREEHWRSFDNSVDAVSFGFVATAILIFMFLVMAVFERFLRPRSPPSSGGVEQIKLDFPSPKIYPNGVSVLMPGEKIPTFIAHPAPPPCPSECVSRPTQDDDSAEVT